MTYKLPLFLLVLLLALTACAPATPTAIPTPAAPRTLTVLTHDSFDISAEVLQKFETENNVKVTFVQGGDTGTALNQSILAKGNPLADVFYGIDNTFLSRALEEGIFSPYDSPLLQQIPPQFQLDPQKRALPVDYGDVCLNYDIAALAEKNLPPPQSLDDLTLPDYRSLLVVQNPASSSPGLAFLFTTIARYGDPGYLDYWQALAANDVLVVNDWETAYYSEFTRWGGTRPIVVSYSSSPAFELLFAEEPMDFPPTAAVVADQTCFRQIEFVGILEGTKNRDLAEKWVDFMLSVDFQNDLPLKMYVFPVNPQATLDPAFTTYLKNPAVPALLPPPEIAANRERWLQTWTENILR